MDKAAPKDGLQTQHLPFAAAGWARALAHCPLLQELKLSVCMPADV